MKEQSNAVLTPHLIHPNYFKRKALAHVTAYRSEFDVDPVSERVRNERKEWCLKQVALLENIPSNAVLGVKA